MPAETKSRNIDALIIVLLVAVLYLLFLYASKSAVSPGEPFAHHMMNFSTPLYGLINVLALGLALAGGAIAFLIFREGELKKTAAFKDKDMDIIKKAMVEISRGAPSKDKDIEVIKKALAELLKDKIDREIPPEKELSIIKKALTEEEKKAVAEIEKAGEITQDSLRFRLGWSKAKVSAIVSNLDRMGVVQRERTGKTYKIYLQKK